MMRDWVDGGQVPPPKSGRPRKWLDGVDSFLTSGNRRRHWDFDNVADAERAASGLRMAVRRQGLENVVDVFLRDWSVWLERKPMKGSPRRRER